MSDKISKEWLIGFIEGEGNFHVDLVKKFKSPSWKFPFEYYPILQFRIFLREDDLEVLKKIKEFFGFGKIYKKKLDSNRRLGFKARDQYVYYIANNKDLLRLKEILSDADFFTKKKKDIELFFKILDIKVSKRHLVEEGYKEMFQLVNMLNSGMRENFRVGGNRKIYVNKV